MSKSDTYKVIGQGSYGCVIKPPLKCNKTTGPIDYNNKVSKLMDEVEAHKEFVENEKIYKLKDIENYILPKPIICKPELSDINIRKMLDNELKNCTNLKYKYYNSKFKLLLLEDGGEDLDSYTKTYNYDDHPDEYSFEKLPLIDKIYLYISLINLFNSLIFFRKHNLVHHDIKLQNIIYNSTTKKSFFIDFGLLTTDDKIKDNSYIYNISHSYFPPETSCVVKGYFMHVTKCKEYKDKMSYDQFVKKHVDTFDSYCLCLDLKKMIGFMYIRLDHAGLDSKTYNALKTFYTNTYQLFTKYCDKDFFERASDLYYLRDQYITFLQLFIDECKAEHLITDDITIPISLSDKLTPDSPVISSLHISSLLPSSSRKSKSASPLAPPPRSKSATRSVKLARRTEELKKYTRKQLQSSAKIRGIKANQTNVALIKELAERLTPLPKQEQYRNYTRKELQSSAKKYGIDARQSNVMLLYQLSKRMD